MFSMLPTSNPTDGAGHGAHSSLVSAGRRAWIVLALSVLVLVALLLRLHTAWQRNHESPDELALRLVGDETNYEGVAGALLQGPYGAGVWLLALLSERESPLPSSLTVPCPSDCKALLW